MRSNGKRNYTISDAPKGTYVVRIEQGKSKPGRRQSKSLMTTCKNSHDRANEADSFA